MADVIYIEDVIKEMKHLLKDKKVVTFRQQPYFGILECKFHDGAWSIFTTSQTHK